MALRPRKKKRKAAKFGICSKCGSRIRQHMVRCKRCNAATPYA